MTGAEILAILVKAVLSGTFSSIAKRGVDGIADWAAEQRAAVGQQFSDADRTLLKELLSDQRSVIAALTAQFKTVRRAGVAIIGPSGAGKSSLFNYLRGEAVIQPQASTSQREARSARFRSRYVSVVDTPGSPFHVDFKRESVRAIDTKPVDVLVVMLAYGYLDTIGLTDLRRPGLRTVFPSREQYIEAARLEELDWLSDFAEKAIRPRRPIPYCMVVINKMDQWLSEQKAVMTYYEEPPVRKNINALVKKLCRSGVSPTFHPIACAYNSFKAQAPCGEMSAEASAITLAITRAEVLKRLSEAQ
jgi:energy-coupling factor transporter ATP-binding protein EcfA2